MKKFVLLKGSKVELLGNFLEKGAAAPDFTLVDKDLKTVSLSAYKGKKKVLATVPSIDTPVCSLETKKFNTLALAHPNVIFLVISKDLPFAQKRFCGQENLSNVILLSDMRPHSTFGQDYGLLISSGPLDGVFARAIIILNEQDKVIYSELVQEL